MTVLSGTNSTVKTETADVHALLQARRNGNGHARNGGSGHRRIYHGYRRVRPHMKNGQNQAASRALGAVLLVLKCGFTIDQAVACTGSHTNYVVAMKWVVVNGDRDLLDRVLRGRLDLFDVAGRVRPMVEIKAAYQKLTPEQRIAWAVGEGAEKLFDEVIGPATAAAMSTKSVTEPVMMAVPEIVD